MFNWEITRRYFMEQNRLHQLCVEQRLIANAMNTLARVSQTEPTPIVTQTYWRLAGLNGQKVMDIRRSQHRVYMLCLILWGYRNNNNPNNPENNQYWNSNAANTNNNTSNSNANNTSNNTNSSTNNNFNVNNIIITLCLLFGVLVISSFIFFSFTSSRPYLGVISVGLLF